MKLRQTIKIMGNYKRFGRYRESTVDTAEIRLMQKIHRNMVKRERLNRYNLKILIQG